MNKILFTLTIIIAAITISTSQQNKFLFHPNGANFFVYGSGSKNYLIHQNRLVQWKLYGNYRKLAAGKRIVSAGDDPSGLAVAEKMSSYMKGLKQEALNAEDYKNYLRHCEGIIGQDQVIVKRIRLLIVKASNSILGPDDKEIIQTEINQLLRQIDMNARFAQFNKKLIIPELNRQGLGLKDVNVVKDTYGSFKLVEAAHNKLIRRRAYAGIKENVLTFKIKGKYLHYVNVMSAMSRISDLDMASEVSNLIKNSILLKSNHGLILKSAGGP